MNLIKGIKSWGLNNIPFITGIIRNTIPIIKLKNFVLVTRFTDVEEVLSRPNVFGVPYTDKMNVITDGDNFFLGMNNTATYTRDVSNMRLVVRRSDVDTIVAPLVEQFTSEIIAASDGKLDLVQDYTRIIPAKLVEKYFGIAGPTQENLIKWTTDLFQYLFIPNNGSEFDKQAISNTKPLRDYIDDLIVKRKANKVKSDDIIGRCLDLQSSNTPGMSDLNIRNNMIGLLIGAIPTISKSAAFVIDYLFDNPEYFALAQAAAKNDDIDTIRKLVLECLRFKSFGAGLFRIALEDYTIARGSLRSKTVTKGSTVFVLTDSAMMDGRKFKSPKSFRLDRPEYLYMHFGYGMHRCFGYYINMVQLPIIIKSILKCSNLRRADGGAGKIEFSGEFPAHFTVLFDTPNKDKKMQSSKKNKPEKQENLVDA